ncbi:hypothetical protein AM1_D0059 (plasmid) [Acaryochloris marina MBIC11017]|uniref:Uncharacterized protein n=1 Tax=Acaryochloris marina (strain MBIC 11017) TaxID=329726 RepID=A8ZNG8_ACAM1|nr:hypothetical protein AM1_D0059 [Acaryochloris marina MBIC11017]
MGKQYVTKYKLECKPTFPGQEPVCRPGEPYQVEVPPIETGIPGVTIPAGINSPIGLLKWDFVFLMTVCMLIGPIRRLLVKSLLLPLRLGAAIDTQRRY